MQARRAALALALLLFVTTSAVSLAEESSSGDGGKATAGLKKQVTKLQQELRDAEKAGAAEKMRAADLEAKVKAAESKVQAAETKVKEAEAQVKAAEAQAKDAQKQAKSLETERDTLKARATEAEALKKKLKAAERELDSTKVELESSAHKMEKLQAKLENTWVNVDALLPAPVAAQVHRAMDAASPHVRSALDATKKLLAQVRSKASDLWSEHAPLVRHHASSMYQAGARYGAMAADKAREMSAELLKSETLKGAAHQVGTVATELEDLALAQIKAVPALEPYASRANVRIGAYCLMALPLLLVLLPLLAMRKGAKKPGPETQRQQQQQAPKQQRRATNGGGGFRAPSPDAMDEVRRQVQQTQQQQSPGGTVRKTPGKRVKQGGEAVRFA